MADRERLVSDVIEAAGGEVIGRVRLQKMIYLLDCLGLESGFTYEYHHYGPYSQEIAIAVDDAVADGLVREDPRQRAVDGMPYSVYRTNEEYRASDTVGGLDRRDALGAINKMQRHSATILELAATIGWLISVEKVPDWEKELMRRKGAKAEGRVHQATGLLRDLGLFPQT